MNLCDLFDLTLKGCAADTALEFGGRQWTFGELEANSNRLAHYLSAEGFRAGDRLAVYLANSVEIIESYLAAVKLGVIFTPINALYREREIRHILSDAEPKAILTNRERSGRLPSGSRFTLVEELASDTAGLSSERPPSPLGGDEAAVLVYTSGTTGRPKGALISHSSLALNAMTLNTCWRMAKEERMLQAMPVFHINGLANSVHTWLSVGFRMRLLERFRKETIFEEFLDFEASFFFGVPTMYERMLAARPETARRIGERMRLFVSGAAPLAAATLERFRDLYGHTILERYGMTETLGAISNPYAGERRPGTVGKPLPGMSIRLSEGAGGEALVKGPTVFAGYWRNPTATEAAFTADGYFRTGDLATRSEDGYFTIRGRTSELIISGGFNIYPKEIEDFLAEQPGIVEAAVVGEPDEVRGERPVAYVVVRSVDDFSAEALGEACRAHLASYKTPAEFRLVDKLPRNALGKLERRRLKGRE